METGGGGVWDVPGCSSQEQVRKLREKEQGSSCLVLGNMVESSDLEDDESYQDLKEDVTEECNKFGMVKAVVVPRSEEETQGPNAGSRGYIYVLFTGPAGASAARTALGGRKFGGRVVRADCFPESLFEENIFVIPASYWQ